MSENIVVTPKEIRAWGNVIKEVSSTSSFIGSHSRLLKQANATLDGVSRNVFKMIGFMRTKIISEEYDFSHDYIVGDEIYLEAYLKNERDDPLANSPVKYYYNDVLTKTVTTNNNGRARVPVTLEHGRNNFKFRFDGNNIYGASELIISSCIGETITVNPMQGVTHSGMKFVMRDCVLMKGCCFPGDALHLSAYVQNMCDNTPSNNMGFYFVITSDNNQSVRIQSENLDANEGDLNYTLNTSQMAPGMYHWKVINTRGEESAERAFRLIDFEYELYVCLLYLKQGVSGVYTGWYDRKEYDPSPVGDYNLELSENFNEYLIITRDSSPVFDAQPSMAPEEDLERIYGVLVDVLNYLRGE